MADWVESVSQCLVCQILLQILVRISITSVLPCFNSSAGMLSTPAALPFFSDLITASTSSCRMGRSPSFNVSWLTRTLGVSLCLVVVEVRTALCPSVKNGLVFHKAVSIFVIDGTSSCPSLLREFLHNFIWWRYALLLLFFPKPSSMFVDCFSVQPNLAFPFFFLFLFLCCRLPSCKAKVDDIFRGYTITKLGISEKLSRLSSSNLHLARRYM